MAKVTTETPMTWKARLRAIPKPRPKLKDLAKKADRHPSLISDYVNGERSPSMAEIEHIEQACQALIVEHRRNRKAGKAKK